MSTSDADTGQQFEKGDGRRGVLVILGAIVLVIVLVGACNASGGGGSGSGGWGEASDEVPGLRYADYYALCDTYGGEWGNATSSQWDRLTSSQQSKVRSIVADDPRCQPD